MMKYNTFYLLKSLLIMIELASRSHLIVRMEIIYLITFITGHNVQSKMFKQKCPKQKYPKRKTSKRKIKNDQK